MDAHALITSLVAALVLAFVFGYAAQRLKLSPIVGYLVAGVAVGPYTPGYVGDAALARQFAEIGVILLMFGVGLKFSIGDLWAIKRVAIPGALAQMALATALGYGLGAWMGLNPAESFVLGFSLSVASTVVLLRALEERNLLKSENGRICVGWLVVEDIAIVLGIVLLPALIAALAPEDGAARIDAGGVALSLAVALGKIALFIALMLIVGGRFFPWAIVRIAHTKSRELLSLGTLAIALGLAYVAYEVFDASFALGAFLAGLALNGSKLSHKVAEDSLPLRDTFAVLFFVSVGMLFDPMTLLREPLAVAGVAAIVMLGKSLAALAITSAFRLPAATGLMIAASLAQIGEFSFLLAGLGRELAVLSLGSYNLVLAGALISIALNPLMFAIASAAGKRAGKIQEQARGEGE